ncbi:MAG: hypothetical protein FWG44_02730 [Oscillospiraceae bacterium]|nr:hypothetical protein [Oscillospiraceae bacterium]
MRGNFTNTGKLVKFILRRERIISTVWILIIVLFSMVLAPGINTMFPDIETRNNFAATLENPIMIAMMGPVYGVGDYTAGAMYSGMMLLWIMMTAGIMNIFLVVRHTRADEEKGRAEVVRSLPTGRLANLNAAIISAVIINAVMAVLLGLGLAATGVESMDLGGSMLYGVLTGLAGLVFAAVAALFSQLSSYKGGATGLSFLTLGVFYMVRAAGDAQMPINNALSCISPLGLAQRSEVYVQNYIYPVFILIAIIAVIIIIAFKLNSIRDIDQGFIPAKPGRKEAKKSLLSSFGLSVRLLKTSIIVWFIVMFALGASYGSILGEIDEFVGDSPEYLTVIGIPEEIVEKMTDADKKEIISKYFGVFITSMMTLVGLIPVIIAAMKPRNEEKDNRAEHILARGISRTKYLFGYVLIAYISSIIMQCATAVGLYLSASSVAGEAGIPESFMLGSLLKSYLSYLPAMWVILGFTILVIGLLPKASGMIWGYYGFVCFMSFIGGFPDLLPAWVAKISPMSYIAKVPLDDINFTNLALLTGLAAVLTALGFFHYRKRDLVYH